MRSVPPVDEGPAKIAVIGAGISGLSAAIHARELGADVHLFEASPRVGGWIRTSRSDSWTLEWGPNSILPSSHCLIDLARRVGLESQWQNAERCARKRFIWKDGALRALPTSPLTIPFSRALSPAGWCRFLMEPWIGRGGCEEESVSTFFRRRFGSEAARVLADVMVSGVSGGRAEWLEIDSFQPKLPQWEKQYGSVISGLLRSRSAPSAPLRRTATLAEGLEQLPRALAVELADRCHLESPVVALEPLNGGWRLQQGGAYSSDTVDVDGVILAIPATPAATLLHPLSSRAGQILQSIPYASLTVVQIGYDASKCRVRPEGFGFLVPSSESLGILGTIWSSSLFPSRCPAGASLATVFMGGSRHPEQIDESDSMLQDRAIGALRTAQGIDLDPHMVQLRRAPRSIPQPHRGHRRKVAALRDELKRWPALAMAGSHLDGLSLESCARSGRDAAYQVYSVLNREKGTP